MQNHDRKHCGQKVSIPNDAKDVICLPESRVWYLMLNEQTDNAQAYLELHYLHTALGPFSDDTAQLHFQTYSV